MSIKILLLEDDLLFAETLIDLLEDENFEVHHVPNGQEALDLVYDTKFHLYLLDINVPLINGVTLLSELRDASDTTPAIFLTSHKDKEMLKNAFISGADDYINKPFDNDELLLRINALLKRNMPTQAKNINGLVHDTLHQRFLYEDNELNLSKKEYQLLELLVTHVNATVPKELIFDKLWTSGESESMGAIRVYITRIKQLLPNLQVDNVRGIGYKLVS